MSLDYSWLMNPDTPEAPAAVVSDFSELARDSEEQEAIANFLFPGQGEKYFQALANGFTQEQVVDSAGKTLEAVGAFLDTLPELQRFQANVEFTTGRQMIRVRNAIDKGIRKWGVDAAEHHLYRYHKREFETADEMFAAAFEDYPENSTTASDLRFIAGPLAAFAKSYNLQGADQLWGDGMVEKARMAVPLLRGVTAGEEPTPAEIEKAQAIITNALNMTGDAFRKEYKGKQAPEAQMAAVDYKKPQGGIMVICYADELSRLTLERRLPGLLDVHFGVGDEPVLRELHDLFDSHERLESKGSQDLYNQVSLG